MEELRSR
jgi:hypothetical protein